MAKLTSKQRKSIWKNISESILSELTNESVPLHSFYFKKMDIICNKLRCVHVISLLQKYDLLGNSAFSLKLPTLNTINNFPSLVDEDYLYDYYYIENIREINMDFLSLLLHNTGWNIYFIEELEEYEELPEFVFNSCTSNIGTHVGSVLFQSPVIELPSVLSNITPDPYAADIIITENLFIWNERIEKAMQLDDELYPEKKEISDYLNSPLLDRYFPFEDTFPREKARACFSYLLGEYFGGNCENTDLWNLSPETIIGYIFADMAAQEILERSDANKKNKGEEKCNRKSA